jgi:thioredoxin-like negative regulator of GroEL
VRASVSGCAPPFPVPALVLTRQVAACCSCCAALRWVLYQAAYSLFDEAGAGDGESPADIAALAASGDLAARLKMAKMLFAKGSETDQQKAIDEALQVLKEDRTFDDGAAQKLLLQFFEVLGPASTLVSRGRRRMASMLFL